MNFDTNILVRYVIDGDIRKAQKQARIVLEKLNTKRDEQFKKEMLGKLDAKGSTLIELPHNLRELLVAEDVSNFPIGRFILRPDEEDIVNKVLAIRTVADDVTPSRGEDSPRADFPRVDSSVTPLCGARVGMEQHIQEQYRYGVTPLTGRGFEQRNATLAFARSVTPRTRGADLDTIKSASVIRQ